MRYGRSLYSGIGAGFERLQDWVQTLMGTIAPTLYARTSIADRGRYLYVFPPYEVAVHVGSFEPNYWAFPADGM